MAVKKLRNIILGTALALGACNAQPKLLEINPSRYENVSLIKLKQEIGDVKSVSDYLKEHIVYDKDQKRVNSPKISHKTRKGRCGDTALLAYYLLEDDYENGKYEDLKLLYMADRWDAHMVCLYKKDGKYGCIDHQYTLNPSYDSPKALIEKSAPHEYARKYRGYTIYDPDEHFGKNWRDSLEKLLDNSRHKLRIKNKLDNYRYDLSNK